MEKRHCVAVIMIGLIIALSSSTFYLLYGNTSARLAKLRAEGKISPETETNSTEQTMTSEERASKIEDLESQLRFNLAFAVFLIVLGIIVMFVGACSYASCCNLEINEYRYRPAPIFRINPARVQHRRPEVPLDDLAAIRRALDDPAEPEPAIYRRAPNAGDDVADLPDLDEN